MKYKSFILSLCILNANLTALPQYEARYKFISDEISITGTREFKKNANGYEISFDASNLLASMYFSSKFNIDTKRVFSKNYDIKIRPKFLKRDQSVFFENLEKSVSSTGQVIWKSYLDPLDFILDPLNAQIMIRIYLMDDLTEFDLNIIDLENGNFKKYSYKVTATEKCIANKKEYTCSVLERSRNGSNRKVQYFLAKELEYMFIKVIDVSPERTNTLELKEILSLG